jgi:hypothetical protein
MSRTMNSQALVLLDRILGLSGPGGEQYTTLDDGNVQQVLDIAAIARRSLTQAGSAGIYQLTMHATHDAGSLSNMFLDPYNFGASVTLTSRTNSFPTPVPRGFDVWLIGASFSTDTNGTRLDWGQLSLQSPSSHMALNIAQTNMGGETQETNDLAWTHLARWDTIHTDDMITGVVGRQLWETTNGRAYVPFNMRLRRGQQLVAMNNSSSGEVQSYLTCTLGLFPEGLGQDIAT